MKDRTGKKNSGFTIIETMIAMAFFSIVSMSVFTLVIHTASSNYRAKILVQATSIAATQIELFKGLSIDDSSLLQTDTPLKKISGKFSIETTITDNMPLEKVPDENGTMQIVTKLIQITVFAKDPNPDHKIQQVYLTRLYFIKTRSL